MMWGSPLSSWFSRSHPKMIVVLMAWMAFEGLPARGADAPTSLTEQQRIVHVLNRLGFGARPGDIARVQKMGLDAYIDQQLYPERIDDRACDKALAHLDTLNMSSAHLLDDYYGDIKRFLMMQSMSGNAAEMKMRYGVDIARNAAPATQPVNPFLPQELAKRDGMRAIGQMQEAKLIRAIMSQRQLNEVMVDFWTNHFNVDMRKDSCRALKPADDRDVIRPHIWGRFRDLLGASAHSAAMLVYLNNNDNSVMRDRSNAEKTVISMYLSYKLGMRAQGVISDKEGPNENYGREVMELHTLGVDGGYTQRDVEEVARCFTGWSFNAGTGAFEFQANRHDNGQKVVLGHVIPAGGGIIDGEAVLDILAAHPATAHHVSYELCQRLVCDDPPADLVNRVADVFLDTDGDLREVVKAIVTSPEFFSPKYYRAKIKSPLEYAISAVRATGATLADLPGGTAQRLRETVEASAAMGYGDAAAHTEKRQSLARHVYDMGEPLFAYSAPTGYAENSAEWVNSGALIDRLNFALALTQQNVTDVHVDLSHLLGKTDVDQANEVFNQLSQAILHGDLSERTRKTLEKNALPHMSSGQTVDVARLTALLLGSPEFQRR